VERLGRVGERAGGVDHVVEEHAVAALHVADDVHHLGDVGALAALVDDGEGGVEALGVGARALHPARVGRHHHRLVEVERAELVEQHGHRVEVVDGDVEEALDLPGVQVDGEHPVDARGGDEVGHELGGDGRAAGHLAVLPGVAVVGHDGGDARGARAAERVGT
jgi:hypothetical protein